LWERIFQRKGIALDRAAISELHCKTNLRDSLIFFDQTFLGPGLGKLFLARESLVSDIPAGDGNIAKPFLQCREKL